METLIQYIKNILNQQWLTSKKAEVVRNRPYHVIKLANSQYFYQSRQSQNSRQSRDFQNSRYFCQSRESRYFRQFRDSWQFWDSRTYRQFRNFKLLFSIFGYYRFITVYLGWVMYSHLLSAIYIFKLFRYLCAF